MQIRDQPIFFLFLQMFKNVKNILKTKRVLNIQNHNERSPHNLTVTLLNEKNKTGLLSRTFTTFVESFNLTKAGITQLKTILYWDPLYIVLFLQKNARKVNVGLQLWSSTMLINRLVAIKGFYAGKVLIEQFSTSQWGSSLWRKESRYIAEATEIQIDLWKICKQLLCR